MRSSWCKRVAMQDRTMEDVWEKFDGMVRLMVLYYKTEVGGVPFLQRLAGSYFV